MGVTVNCIVFFIKCVLLTQHKYRFYIILCVVLLFLLFVRKLGKTNALPHYECMYINRNVQCLRISEYTIYAGIGWGSVCVCIFFSLIYMKIYMCVCVHWYLLRVYTRDFCEFWFNGLRYFSFVMVRRRAGGFFTIYIYRSIRVAC